MPLLKGKLYTPLSPPKDLSPEEEVFVVKQTNEVCRSYDEYIEKVLLYTSQVWTCRCTGETNLDYDGALESEQKNLKLLEKFPKYFEKPILQTVHHNTSADTTLVDDCANQLKSELFEGDRVDVTLSGAIHHDCVITKVMGKSNGEQQLSSASSSPSSDKENSLNVSQAAENSTSLSKNQINTELSYEVRGENNAYFKDVSPECLRRTTKIPSKKLIKLFIRSNAVLEPKNGTNLWVVQEHLIKKYALPDKYGAMERQSLFETPEQASVVDSIQKKKSKKKQLEMPSQSENNKPPKKKPSSKTRKPDPAQKKLDHFRIYLPKLGTQSPVKGLKTSIENRTYSPVKIIDSPVKEKETRIDDLECVLTKTTVSNSSSSLKKSTTSVPSSGSSARPVNKSKKNATPSRKSLDFTGKIPKKTKAKDKSKPTSKLSPNSFSKSPKTSVDKSHTETSSTCKSPSRLAKMSEGKFPSKSSKLTKGKSPLKAFMSVNNSKSPKISKARSPSKSSELLGKNSSLRSPRKPKDNCSSKSPKLLKGNSPSKSPKVSTGSLILSPKIRIVDCLLSDSTKKRPIEDNGKGKKTPKKMLKFAQESHNDTIEKGLKKKSRLKQTTIFDMAKKSEVSAAEMASGKPKSPEVWSLKVLSEKKFMTEEEREKAREEKKRKRKEEITKKQQERKLEKERQRILASERYEDTELELQDLPEPTAVITPKGISLETFGDVLMVVEFVSGLKMFLTPGRSIPYLTTGTLMEALVSGKEGFPLLSKLLVALLQTLLQDEETEGKDIGMPLKEMPLTECTAFELARLYLEHNVTKSALAGDRQDVNSDSGKKCDNNSTEGPANVVPANLLNLLKESEFYSAPAEDKLKVLVYLCNDVMASVSFEDYIEQQMEKASSLRRQIKDVKKEKNKRNRKEKERLREEQEKNKKKVEETTEQKSKQQTLNFEVPSVSPEGGVDKEMDSKDNTTTPQTGDKAATKDGEEEKKKKVQNPIQESSLSQAIRIRKEQRALNLLKEEKRKAEETEELKRQQGETELLKCLDCLRLSPLGCDRFHRRYWLFHGASPGLYVEDGWMDKCTLQPVNDKGCIAQDVEDKDCVARDVEDTACVAQDVVVINDDEEGPENCKKDIAPNVVVIDDVDGSGNCKEVVTQNVNAVGDEQTQETTTNCKEDADISKSLRYVDYSWSCYETIEDVDCLLKCLAVQGTRESALSRALKENYNDIARCIKKGNRFNKRNEEVDKDGEEHLLKSLKDDLVDIARRLSKGKLGEMEDLDRYEENVAEAKQSNDLGSLLLDLLESVFPRALKGGFNETGESKSRVKEQWKEAVGTARTFSRLHLLLDLLEEAVLWDKSTEKAKCKLCRRKADEENLLICCSNPECSLAYHLFCLRPSLSEMPKYSWLCPVCKPEISRSSRGLRSNYNEDEEDQSSDEEEDSDKSSVEDSHEDYCDVCGEEGELVCCDTCPLVYHIGCHDPPLRNVPRGEWSCCKCRWGGPKKSKSLAVSAAEKKKKAAKKNAAKASRASRNRQRPQLEEDSDSEDECYQRKGRSKRSCAGAKRSLKEESDSGDSSDGEPTRKKRTSKRTCTVRKNMKEESESDDESDAPSTRKKSNKTGRNKQKMLVEDEDLESGDEGSLTAKRTSKQSHKPKKRNMKEISEDDNEEEEDSPPRKTKRTLGKKKEEQNGKTSNKKSLAKSKKKSKVDEAGKRTSTDSVQQQTKKRHRTAPELEQCEAIYSQLWSDENSWPFRAPVNPREVPDYAEVVSEPMDLSTVWNKLNTLQYESAESFAADIRLMFRNCDAYNLNTSEVGQAGIDLEELFESLLAKEFPAFRRKSSNKRRR